MRISIFSGKIRIDLLVVSANRIGNFHFAEMLLQTLLCNLLFHYVIQSLIALSHRIDLYDGKQEAIWLDDSLAYLPSYSAAICCFNMPLQAIISLLDQIVKKRFRIS